MKEVYDYLAKYDLELITGFDQHNGQYKVYLQGRINGQIWQSVLGFSEREVDLLWRNQLQIYEKLIYHHQKERIKAGITITANTRSMEGSLDAAKYAKEAFNQMGIAVNKAGVALKEAVMRMQGIPLDKLENNEPVYVNI